MQVLWTGLYVHVDKPGSIIEQIKYAAAVDMQSSSANELLNSQQTQEQNPQILCIRSTYLHSCCSQRGNKNKKDYLNVHTL